MRRVQFIELHEQPWFPSPLRHEITDTLQFGLNLLKAYAPIAPLLRSALDSTQSRSIVDMCSGAGGPWLTLSRKLHPDAQVFDILFTDKYPNLRAFQNVRAASENHIAFCPDSVEAMKVLLSCRGSERCLRRFIIFHQKRLAPFSKMPSTPAKALA